MKIFRGFIALAATTALMTSCMDNSLPSLDLVQNLSDEASVKAVKLGTITQSDTYKFTIKTSTTAEISIDGKRVAVANSYDKGEKKIGSEIKIKAVAVSADYSRAEVVKTVKLDANGKIIYIDIPKLATKSNTMTASEAKAKASTEGSVTIENSATNKKLSYKASTNANVVFSNNAIKNVADGNVLSIDVENACTNNIDETLSDGVEEDFNVMVVKSAAKNVTLGEKATVTIKNSNFEKGMLFKISSKNEEKVVEENATISFDIDKLADYTISCHAVVILDSVSYDTPMEGIFAVPLGNQKITYYTKSGYECKYQSNEFITKYLDAKFGAYTEQGKQIVTIANSDQKANVPYKISQKVYYYTVMFGTISVNVTVYGADELEVSADEAETYRETKVY